MKKSNICTALCLFLCMLFLIGCGNAAGSKGYAFDDFVLEDLTQETLDAMFADSGIYENLEPEHSSEYDVYYAKYNILDKAYYINAFGAQFDFVLANYAYYSGSDYDYYALSLRADIRDYSSKEQDKLLEKMDTELSKWGEPAMPGSVAMLCYEKPLPSGKTAHVEVITPFGYLILSEMIVER